MLKMTEVFFISDRNPVLSILACMLRSSPTQFSRDVIGHALALSESPSPFSSAMSASFSPSPPLARWVGNRCRVYGVFNQIFLENNNLDLVTNYLDPNVSVYALGIQR